MALSTAYVVVQTREEAWCSVTNAWNGSIAIVWGWLFLMQERYKNIYVQTVLNRTGASDARASSEYLCPDCFD